MSRGLGDVYKRQVEAGRVEKFRAKFAAKKQALNTAAEAAKSTK